MTGIGAGLVQEVVWFFNLRDVIFASQDMINLNGAQIISKSEFLNYFVTIGASGAVFGILLAFAMIFPNVPLYLMFIPIPIKAKYFVIFYGLAELFMGVASFGGDTVAHFAHLGVCYSVISLIRYWKRKMQTMDGIFTNLKRMFQSGNILSKLIYINVGLFILIRLASVLFMLFNVQGVPFCSICSYRLLRNFCSSVRGRCLLICSLILTSCISCSICFGCIGSGIVLEFLQ